MTVIYITQGNKIQNVPLQIPTRWCTSPDSRMLKAGDWNGDMYTDFVCHTQITGDLMILPNMGGILNRGT